MTPDEFVNLEPGDQVVSPTGHVGTVLRNWSGDIVLILAAVGYTEQQLIDWTVIPRLLASTGQATPRPLFLTWREKDDPS